MLANRFWIILPDFISENHLPSFQVEGITDNVLVAFELLHYMNQKKRGAEGEVALKLDVSKAYDHVDWEFWKCQMRHMGFLGSGLPGLCCLSQRSLIQ